MRKTLAIFEKEFKSFFYSPLAYVIIAIFTLITGYLFYNVLSWFVEQSFMMTMQAQQYRQAPPKFNVNLHLIKFFQSSQRVNINDAINTLIFILKFHVVLNRTQVVTDMLSPGWPSSGEHSTFHNQSLRIFLKQSNIEAIIHTSLRIAVLRKGFK